MKTNLGTTDRILRIIIAVAIGSLYLFDVVTGTWGIILLIVAAILALTGLIRFCPLYFLLNLRTNKQHQQ